MIKYLVDPTTNDTVVTVTKLTQSAKDIFKANSKPYIIKDSVDGPLTRVVFTEHFIMVMRDADSNECMAKMSEAEKRLYWDYINYQGIVNSVMFANPGYTDLQVDAAAKIEYDATNVYGTPELIVRTLSNWAYAETLQFAKNSCFNTMHTWR